MLEFIILIYILYLLIKMYAAFMEIGFVTQARILKAIILSPSNYAKAAAYKIASQKLSLVSSFFDFILFFGWITFGLTALEATVHIGNEAMRSVLFVMSFIAINYVLLLPFDLYQTFGLDKKFGFSTINVKTFILDQIKSILMFILFGGAFFWAMSVIIMAYNYWWFYGFLFSFVVILFINMIYPIIIVPLFNKLTPLEDENLKSSIEALLNKAGLKSSGVFSLDASKRDNRLNAYFGGLGSSKRVVLFDTLIAKLEKHELLAVLGHELGHFTHKDILKNIASSALMLFVMFALFGNLPVELFDSLHVNKSAASIMVLFLLLSPVVSFILMPLFGLLSRYNEYRADEYGSVCESKEALASALVKLADENKSFPFSHPLTIALYFTHPPLTERLKKLGMHFEEGEALAH
ncbi:M48 family metallopeptidase [Sulfurospirillum diekertiae]|uniref:M48 family metallopeptidase n=2 Tax=Sulfurospirillum diekertiae TaxID=1854492 RepID=A0A6G9VRI6_9BACT|nr:M48 family metallopeptidase [Sulfurospirillum diekertiae]QIR74970.1 M48 family metallopeptidase [Sulfurospirillum diekertiae]QIR77634.1 M48 family metallopeptidase [Sulfurospirillum diekertiae]